VTEPTEASTDGELEERVQPRPQHLGVILLMGGTTVAYQIGSLSLTGCLAVRRLGDGRLLAVEPLLFGRARLCIGRPEEMAADGMMGGWDDHWEYPSCMAALNAIQAWTPSPEAPEPVGWTRHPTSGRRRPDGNPEKEYIRR